MNDVPDGLDQPGLDAGYVRLDKVDETLGKNFRNAANLFKKDDVKAYRNHLNTDHLIHLNTGQ